MFVGAEMSDTVWRKSQKSHCGTKTLNKITESLCHPVYRYVFVLKKKRPDEGGEDLSRTCPVISRHDSHFLLLLDLLLFFLVVLHDLQPLSLDQAALLDVELLLRLQVETKFQLHHHIVYVFIDGFFSHPVHLSNIWNI